MVWKTIAVSTEDAEKGTGSWEPFGVGHDEDGDEVVLCKGMVDVEKDPKASEIGGGLGTKW